VTETNAGDD